MKTRVARATGMLLRRPISLARSMGLVWGPKDPWVRGQFDLIDWPGAEQLACSIDAKGRDFEPPKAVPEDFPPSILLEIDAWQMPKTQKRALLETLSEEPPTTLRVNQVAGPRKRILQEFSPRAAKAGRLSPQAVVFPGYAKLSESPLHRTGAYEMQDEGSQVMAYFALWPSEFGKLLGKKPGRVPRDISGPPELPAVPTDLKTVIDACAGAGGKTLALMDALEGKGRIYAYDVSAGKLRSLRERAGLAGRTNFQAVALEEGKEEEKLEAFHGSADVVLVDAPCSGWGVLRRNPDIKWRVAAREIGKMEALQERVLSLYSKLVRPGGRLVYGTCTFRVSETTDVVDGFLSREESFTRGENGYLGPGPTDGFYFAELIKSL